MELEHTIVLIHEMSVFGVLSVSCMLLVTFILAGVQSTPPLKLYIAKLRGLHTVQ